MSRLGAALAFLAVPALAAAQGAPLTLAEALEMAGRLNPEVRAAQERATAQQRRAEAVARSVWPRLSLSTSGSRSDIPSTVFAQRLNSGDFTQEDFAISRLNAPGALSHLTTVASLELPVDAFGKVRAQERGQSAGDRVHPGSSSLLFTVVEDGEVGETLAFLRRVREAARAEQVTKIYVATAEEVR